MEINIITPSDALWGQVITCAESCSWRGTQFLVDQMKQGRIHGWERVLVAVEDGKIAGFCAVCEHDCIPDVTYTPFVTTLFVEEEYRGHRLSQRLIETAVEYLRTLDFDAAYLLSDHVGLYEKYGFSVIDKCPTPWGKEEQIFRRILSPLEFQKLSEVDLSFLTNMLMLPDIIDSLHWNPSPLEVQSAYIDQWSNDPDEAHYIINRDGAPVGWIKLNGLSRPEQLWISMLVIHPQHQGNHYGRDTLIWVEQMAQEKNYQNIGIQTTADNIPAIVRYIKSGYRMSFNRNDNRFVFTKELLDN